MKNSPPSIYPIDRRNGFTLVELIMVIALLGILGVMGAEFISQSFQGFSASDTRMEIYEEGSTALARMERELRNAVPNAVRVEPGGLGITFGLVDESAMTCPVGTNPQNCVFGQYIDSNPAGRRRIRDRTDPLPRNSIVSLYNRNWTDFSTTTTSARRLYRVRSIRKSNNRMTFFRRIIAASPNKRFYAVDKAVRYFLENRTLIRAAFSITSSSYLDPIVFPAGKPLAEGLSGLSFDFAPGSLTNSALVSIRFTMSRDDETVHFHKEVQIRNVP